MCERVPGTACSTSFGRKGGRKIEAHKHLAEPAERKGADALPATIVLKESDESVRVTFDEGRLSSGDEAAILLLRGDLANFQRFGGYSAIPVAPSLDSPQGFVGLIAQSRSVERVLSIEPPIYVPPDDI